jgi:hypothetical protein
MARYTGIGATIGLYEEATYGEAIKTSSLIETPDLKGGAESLSAEKEILRPEFLESTALREGDVTVLSETVSGGLMLNPRFNGKAWWAVISHLCGVNSTEAGAGPWTHTIEFGGAIDDTTAPENVGLQLVADRGGTTGAVGYTGLKPVTAEISFNYNAAVELTAEFIGQESENTSNLTFTEPSANPLIVGPYTSATAFLTAAAVAYDVSSSSIKFEQPRIGVQDIASSVIKAPQLDGFAKVGGSFETFALNETASAFDVFTVGYRTQTAFALVLNLAGHDGSNACGLKITVPKALITSNPTSHVDGPGVQRVTVEWEGYIDAGTTDYLAEIVLTNSNDLANGY